MRSNNDVIFPTSPISSILSVSDSLKSFKSSSISFSSSSTSESSSSESSSILDSFTILFFSLPLNVLSSIVLLTSLTSFLGSATLPFCCLALCWLPLSSDSSSELSSLSEFGRSIELFSVFLIFFTSLILFFSLYPTILSSVVFLTSLRSFLGSITLLFCCLALCWLRLSSDSLSELSSLAEFGKSIEFSSVFLILFTSLASFPSSFESSLSSLLSSPSASSSDDVSDIPSSSLGFELGTKIKTLLKFHLTISYTFGL